MRSLLVSAMVAAFLVMLTVVVQGGTASADNPPHEAGAGATADSCAGCHRAHTGQAAELLKSTQPALCYSCHGTGAAGSDLDVENGANDDLSTALKGGGFTNALIDTTDSSLPSDVGGSTIGVTSAAGATSAHTVDGTAQTVWGNGAAGSGVGSSSFNLACGTCHDPHGNGKYRILRPSPPGSGGSGTSVTDEVTKDYDTTDYFNVAYLGSSISNWCAECHTRYLAASGSEDTPLAGDSDFTYRHRSNGSGSAPTCIKCHASHGSNASMGTNSDAVPWPGGAAATSGANSRLLKMDNRGICQKCHEK